MRGRDLGWWLAVALIGGCGFHVAGSTPGPGDGGDDAPDLDDAPELVDAPLVVDGPPGSTTRRKVQLTFHNAARNIALDDFVALVVLDPTRIDYGLTQPDGADLRFTDADGTPLAYEIDEWVAGGTSYVWVRVPQIDAASDADFIYLHYGDPALTAGQDPAAVWAGQGSVWHLGQDPGPHGSGDIKDSGVAQDHGTATAAMQSADLVAGVIGHGLHFTGSLTGVTANAIVLPTYTWSMWVRGEAAPVSGSSNHDVLSDGDVNFNFAWDHNLTAYTGAAAQRDAATWNSAQPATAWAGMTWYFVVGTYDGTQLCLYRDGGTGSCTTAGGPLAPVGGLELGLASSNANTFRGWVDEVRISSRVIAAKRIDAELQNQRATSANPFVVFGTTELD